MKKTRRWDKARRVGNARRESVRRDIRPAEKVLQQSNTRIGMENFLKRTSAATAGEHAQKEIRKNHRSNQIRVRISGERDQLQLKPGIWQTKAMIVEEDRHLISEEGSEYFRENGQLQDANGENTIRVSGGLYFLSQKTADLPIQVELLNLSEEAITIEEVVLQLRRAKVAETRMEGSTRPCFGSHKKDLPDEQRQRLATALMWFRHVFFKGLGCSDIVEHDIPLNTDRPLFKTDYIRSQSEEEAVNIQVAEWRRSEFFEPTENYRYNSPLVLVRKPNGDLRLCVDYRIINKHTLHQDEFIPLPEDIFMDIGATKPTFISVCDMNAGYQQIKMKVEDKEKTAFTTSTGRWQFKSVPFGLKGAPFTFKKAVTKLIEGLGENIRAFFDDTILFDAGFDDHVKNLEKYLSRISELSFSLNIKK